ncbi:ABC transporter permease (plasmid) [Rhodococcus opacus]|uniref:ABC transporter permease n=1 Tax=Rhodococcus opacus TaxID=37919 RepID=UPI0034D35BA4
MTSIQETATNEPAVAGPRPDNSGGGTLLRIVEKYALVALTIGLVIFFSVWPKTAETFPTTANIKILLASQAVIGLIAVGVLLPLIVREFDLSIGSVAALSAILVVIMLTNGVPIVVAAVIGLVIGVVVGVVNAVITTYIGVSGIVTTLGMSTIVLGIVMQITGGLAPTADIPPSFTNIGNGTVLGLPIIFVVLLIVTAIAYFVLEHTPFGRQLYAAGSNPQAAALVGIGVGRLKVWAFIICGVMAALGGILYVARAGGADPRINSVFLLPALAAAFLSAAAIRPGRYNVLGAIVAIYFLAVLNNGLSLAGAPSYVSDYSNGIALIAGVAVAMLFRSRGKSST